MFFVTKFFRQRVQLLITSSRLRERSRVFRWLFSIALMVTTIISTARAQANYAVQFDGTNAYASVPDSSKLHLSTFTVETWFRRDGPGAGTSTGTSGIASAVPLVTKGRADSGTETRYINYFLGIDTNGDVLAADFQEAQAGSSPGLNHPVRGTTPVTTGVWHHAAATYDGNKWQLFLDGTLESELIVGQPPASASTQPLAIGSALNSTNTPSGFFNGVIDEVRIWDHSLTGAEISANLNIEISSAPGLMSRWGFNEGTGATAHDSARTEYTTSFDLTESPISEGNSWLNGGVNGGNTWANIRTISGYAYGTQIDGYNDSIAIRKGVWGKDQFVTVHAYRGAGLLDPWLPEAEIFLRGSITTGSIRGYECLFSMDTGIPPGGQAHLKIVRWNGPYADFTEFTDATLWLPNGTRINTGDELKCSIIGNTITMYINGVQKTQYTDASTRHWEDGTPGIGFWHLPSGNSGDAEWGFTDFHATDQNPADGTIHGAFNWVAGAPFHVNPTAPTITSTNSTTFTAGSPASFTVTTTGSPTPTISEQGALPGGVTFIDNGNGTATFAGTPSSAGIYSFTITAANGMSPDATQNFTLTVSAPPTLSVTPATLSFAYTIGGSTPAAQNLSVTSSGSALSYTVSKNGAWLLATPASGTTPGSVSVSVDPSGLAAGSYNATVTISAPGAGNSPQTVAVTLIVNPAPGTPPAITSPSSTTFVIGSPGSFTVTATGLPAPALSEQGALPNGVTFTDNGNGTATLAGTPTATGIFPLIITAANGVVPNATQNFTLTVNAPSAISAVSGQNTGRQFSGSPAFTLAFPRSLTVGNQVVVTMHCYDSSVAPVINTPSRASGTGGLGAFAVDGSGNFRGSYYFAVKVFRAPVTASGSVSLRFSATNCRGGSVAINEFTGIAGTDGLAVANSGTGALESSGNVVTSGAGMVLMTSAEDSTSNFTYTLSDVRIYSDSAGASHYTSETQFKITPAAGAYVLTAGTGRNWYWWAVSVAYRSGQAGASARSQSR